MQDIIQVLRTMRRNIGPQHTMGYALPIGNLQILDMISRSGGFCYYILKDYFKCENKYGQDANQAHEREDELEPFIVTDIDHF